MISATDKIPQSSKGAQFEVFANFPNFIMFQYLFPGNSLLAVGQLIFELLLPTQSHILRRGTLLTIVQNSLIWV